MKTYGETKTIILNAGLRNLVIILIALSVILPVSVGCGTTAKTQPKSSYKILYLVKTKTDGPAAASVRFTNASGEIEDIYYSAHKRTFSYEMTVEPGTLVEFKAKLETKGTITCMLVQDGILKDEQTTDHLWSQVTCSHIVGE